MGQTAIVSPQIIDSTSIGRDLITAADQAAAQAIIGVTGVDTGADYTWTGNHQFDEPVELLSTDWADANGVINQPDINGFHYLAFNSSNVFRASALDFIPMTDGTKNLGRSDLRFADVFSVDGDFSGTLSAVTVAGQTNTLLLRSNGGTSNISLSESGAITLTAYGNIYQQFTLTGVNYREDCIPTFNGTLNLGLATNRWANVASVDGSFSGSLNSEAGGSYKLYNLGAEGDTDTEYLETSFTANVATISAKATGSGVVRDLNFSGHDGDFSGTVTVDQIQNSLGDEGIKFDANYGYLTASGGGANVLRWAGGTFEVYGDFDPRYNNTSSLGSDNKRWVGVNSVAGSFSGDLISEVGGSYKLYNLGTDGDTDTEYLETSWNVSNTLRFDIKSTGTGVVRNLNIYSGGSYLQLNNSNSTLVLGTTASQLNVDNSYFRFNKTLYGSTTGVELGTSGFRFGNVYSVDGDFSGTITCGTGGLDIAAGSQLRLYNAGDLKLGIGGGGVFFYENTIPNSLETHGTSTKRWGNVYSVGGSFSGNLINEVGGSYKLYNLGADGDADTEYLETSWDTNECVIRPKYTGTGTFRGLKLQAALDNRGFLTINSTGSISLGYNTTSNFTVQSGETRFGADIFPATSNTHTLGEAARRWSNVASVDGDFSGNMTLSNLPTSDPAVAGQLWNDSGTVKISAG